jgi:tetratricopeptide (TPR) repeat protein
MSEDNENKITSQDEYITQTTEQGLAVFHAGRWDEAVTLLRQVAIATDMPEVQAALGIALTFQAYPLELGTGVQPLAILYDEAKQVLTAAAECFWPEIGACLAWIQLLEAVEHPSAAPPEALQTLVNFATQSSWFPVRALACRALAFYDRRQEALNSLAPSNTSNHLTGMELVLAEAKLEAGQINDEWWSVLSRSLAESCWPLTVALAETWRQLLSAEAHFAHGDDLSTVIPPLQAFVEQSITYPAPASTYVHQEQQRLAARISALLIRIALAHGRTAQAASWLEHTAITVLSRWEREYLHGLVAWQQGNRIEARSHLEQSLSANPFQTRVRVELGILLATEDPETALSSLAALPDIPDAVAGRAAVLTRLGRLTEAQEALAVLDQPEKPLPTRLLWPAAQNERLRRSWLLRVDLAEHQGNWPKALIYLEHAHRIASQDLPLFRARQMWMRYQYARQCNATDPQTADHLLQQVDKELSELSSRPLTGDAMFYRSVVAAERLPERAIKDWQALLRQRQWAERSPAVTGPRLVWIGDRLWKAGLPDDAIRAYRRALALGAERAKTRLALALRRAQRAETTDQAAALDPDNPIWPLLAAFTALSATPPDIDTALAHIESAHQHNAPPVLINLVETACALIQGNPQAAMRIPEILAQDLADILPVNVRAYFAVMLPERAAVEVLQTLMEQTGEDWIALCPVSPALLLERAVRELSTQGQLEEALTLIRQLAQVGVALPTEISIKLLAACAVQAGLQGQFDQAEYHLQQAQQLLTSLQREEKDR